MARCSAFIFTAIFCIISVNSLIPERNLSDPSVEIIKQQDAEEGYDFRVKESLVCKDPKTPDNVVVKVDGDPPHLYAKVNVTCLAGKHFTGSTKNALSVQCLPLPHPCMCMAAWQTTDDYQLVYDFNCTTDKTIDVGKDSKDNLPLYPLEQTENEGTDVVTNIQAVKSEAGNSEKELKNTIETPETASKQPELIIHSYDINPQRDTGYEIKEEILEPEEDLIGTFHDYNTETNQVDDIHVTIENPETNPDIIEQNKREVQEEHTNSVETLKAEEDVNNIESKETAVNIISYNDVEFYTEEKEQPISENTKTTITNKTKNTEVVVDDNVVENEYEENIPFAQEVAEEVEERPEEFVTDQEETEELEAEEAEVQHTEEQVYEEKEEEEHEEYEPEEEIYEENKNEDTVQIEEPPTEESEIKADRESMEVQEDEDSEYNELSETAENHKEVLKQDTETSEKTNNQENIPEENAEIEENAADEEEMHEEMEHREHTKDEENTEENEDISEKNESTPNTVFTEVYPLQRPSIKEPSRIYDAIKAKNLNLEKEEEKEDGEGEEVTKDISEESDVEPPGFLSNVQTSPVRASQEEMKTDERAVCSLPVQTGFCKAYFRRFHFNSKTGECEKFVYGGCGGNGNNFETLRDCENKCVKHSS